MHTAVIIPNWNGLPFVLDCLNALEKQSIVHDIVLVDNGSVDGSVEKIKRKYPNIHIIEFDHNTGFTGGVNAGLQFALDNGYEFAALLNNDATPAKEWLKELVTTIQSDNTFGVVTCKLLHTDGKYFDSTGDFYTNRGIAFPRGRNVADNGQYDNQEFVFSATGGASLYRCSMLHNIGLFDDYFFAYYEDVDISFRAQLAGWKVVYQPKSVCYHATSSTSSRISWFGRYHSVKNIPILYIKNMPALLFWKYLPFFIYQLCRQFAGSIVKKQGTIHLKALWALFKHLPRAFRDRHYIQKTKKLTAAELDALLVHGKPPTIPGRDD